MQPSSVLAVCPGCASSKSISSNYSYAVTIKGTNLTQTEKNLPHYRCTAAHAVERLFGSFTLLDYLAQSYLTADEVSKIQGAFAANKEVILQDCLGRANVPFQGMTVKQVVLSSFWSYYQQDMGHIFDVSLKTTEEGKWTKLSHTHLMLPDVMMANHFDLQVDLFPIKPTVEAVSIAPPPPPIVVTTTAANDESKFTDGDWLEARTGYRIMPLGVPLPTLDGKSLVFPVIYRSKTDKKPIPKGASKLFSSQKVLGIKSTCFYLEFTPHYRDPELSYSPMENFFRELTWIWIQNGSDQSDRLRLMMHDWVGFKVNCGNNSIIDQTNMTDEDFVTAASLPEKHVDREAWKQICTRLGFVKPAAAAVKPAAAAAVEPAAAAAAVEKKASGRKRKMELELKDVSIDLQTLLHGGAFSVKMEKEDTALRLYVGGKPTQYGTMHDATQTSASLMSRIKEVLPGQLAVNHKLALNALKYWPDWNELVGMCATPEDHTPSCVKTVIDGKTIRVRLGKFIFKVNVMEEERLEKYCRGRSISELTREPHCTAYWNLWHLHQGDAQKMELATRTKAIPPPPVHRSYDVDERNRILFDIGKLEAHDVAQVVQVLVEADYEAVRGMTVETADEVELTLTHASDELVGKLDRLVKKLSAAAQRKRPLKDTAELLPLAKQTEQNAEVALEQINDELKRLNSKVVDRDHAVAPEQEGEWKKHSLDPQVIAEQVAKQLEEREESSEYDDDDTVSSSDEEEEPAPLLTEAEQREQKRAQMKRQREEMEPVADLTPQAAVMEKARKAIELTLIEWMRKGVTFVDLAGSLRVMDPLNDHEAFCVEAMPTTEDMLKEASSFTWGELLYHPRMFWNLARWSGCDEAKMRAVCINFSTFLQVKFFDHDGGVSLGIDQGGRKRCVAAMNYDDSQQTDSLLSHCAVRSMTQLMDEPGSVNFWLLMRYCQKTKQKMSALMKPLTLTSQVVLPMEVVEIAVISTLTTMETEQVEVAVFDPCPLLQPGQMIDTNMCDALTTYLHDKHDVQFQPKVECYNSHFFDWVSRRGYAGIPRGKDLLVFVIHEPGHFFTMAYSVPANRFFIFDSMPRPSDHYQLLVGQTATILGVKPPCQIQMVAGPLQAPGSNDCGLFAMVAEFLLATQSFNDLVSLDFQTWVMSVTPAWWTADQISGLRAELRHHLVSKAAAASEVNLNEHGKRDSQQEEEVQATGEKRVRFTEPDE